VNPTPPHLTALE
jgi:hypothetical protein